MKPKRSIADIMRNDGPNPHLEIKAPRCPLCHDLMTREKRNPPSGPCFVFHCAGLHAKDQHKFISIKVNDPFVDRWDAALKDEKINCVNPRCSKHGDTSWSMRYFATRTGYMQALCPPSVGGCGAAIHNGLPDRKPDDKTFSPDEKGPLQ